MHGAPRRVGGGVGGGLEGGSDQSLGRELWEGIGGDTGGSGGRCRDGGVEGYSPVKSCRAGYSGGYTGRKTSSGGKRSGGVVVKGFWVRNGQGEGRDGPSGVGED